MVAKVVSSNMLLVTPISTNLKLKLATHTEEDNNNAEPIPPRVLLEAKATNLLLGATLIRCRQLFNKDLFQSQLKQTKESSSPISMVLSPLVVVPALIMLSLLLVMVQRMAKITGSSRTLGAPAGVTKVMLSSAETTDRKSVV